MSGKTRRELSRGLLFEFWLAPVMDAAGVQQFVKTFLCDSIFASEEETY